LIILVEGVEVKQVVYRGSVLAKGSTALELWENWQRDKSADRNKLQKKLDDHMKDVALNDTLNCWSVTNERTI
jgi:hypothetical protein